MVAAGEQPATCSKYHPGKKRRGSELDEPPCRKKKKKKERKADSEKETENHLCFGRAVGGKENPPSGLREGGMTEIHTRGP